jgi:uncharacterized protein
MKLSFLIFIAVFIIVYSLVNYYVVNKGFQVLPANLWVKITYVVVFVFLAYGYLMSRVLERTDFNYLHHIFYWVGSYWMAALVYLLMAAVVFDILGLTNFIFHFLPAKGSLSYLHYKQIYFSVAFTATILLLLYGSWNAANARLKTIELAVHKKADNLKTLNIVMVSDIHLGSLFGKQKVNHMVNRINSLHPDLVLLVGDLLDEAQNPIFKDQTGEPLKMLQAPFGVYGVTGNHEYIGGINRAVHYIESLNVKLIRDTSILIKNSFYLAGREDRDINRFSAKGRKSLNEVVQTVDHKLPVILMDHQPFGLNQAVENGVDLQLSGHTHHGQFWPINWITNKIYEVSWGYKQKGNTHIYVSSGYGTWGPPIRIGNHPEIVNIKLSFDSEN